MPKTIVKKARDVQVGETITCGESCACTTYVQRIDPYVSMDVIDFWDDDMADAELPVGPTTASFVCFGFDDDIHVIVPSLFRRLFRPNRRYGRGPAQERALAKYDESYYAA